MTMTLTKWCENGWLRRHQTSREEISDLLGIADRDLADAGSTISADWRFGIAYNAALKLCTILLYVEGYQPEKTLQHYRTIMALPMILGPQRKKDADYLNACRAKRNLVEYDRVGGVTDQDADELIGFVRELKQEVLSWLREKHSSLA
jgi:hypothetical protein